MKRFLAAAALVALAATSATAGVGDAAPRIEAKETIHISSLTPRDTDGKVLFVEVFRTW